MATVTMALPEPLSIRKTSNHTWSLPLEPHQHLDETGERQRATAAMQAVSDRMVAMTESFRQQFRNKYGHPEEPPVFLTPCELDAAPAARPLPKPTSRDLLPSRKAKGRASVPPKGRPSVIRREERRFTIDYQPRPGTSESSPPTVPPLPNHLPDIIVTEESKPHRSLLPRLATTFPLRRASRATVLLDDFMGLFKLSTPILPTRLQMPNDRANPEHLDVPGVPRVPIEYIQQTAMRSEKLTEDSTSSHSGWSELDIGSVSGDALYDVHNIPSDPEVVIPEELLMPTQLRRKPVPPPRQDQERSCPTLRGILAIVTLCLGHVLVAATFTQALLPATIIEQSLHEGTTGRSPWYSTAFLLAAGAFAMPLARLAEEYGRKIMFAAGLSWLSVWSLLAGLTPFVREAGGSGTAYMSFCRAMQGVSAATIIPTGVLLLRQAWRPGIQGDIIMGVSGASAPLGFVLGAVMSSLFAELASWSWEFYIMAMVSALLAALSLIAIPTSQEVPLATTLRRSPAWARLDLLGATLLVASLVLFAVGWSEVPIVSFEKPYTYFLMIISAILFAAFLYVESKASHPLIPVGVLKGTSLMVIVFIAGTWGAFGVWIWYFLQFVEQLRESDPLLTSAALSPFIITSAAASFGATYVLGDKSRARWAMVVSSAVLCAGCIFAATAQKGQTYWLNPLFSVLLVSIGIVAASPPAWTLFLLEQTKQREARQRHDIRFLIGLHDALGSAKNNEEAVLPTALTFTTAMWAMATAMGMAGAVERAVRGYGDDNDEQEDSETGIRAAQYFSVGLSVLSLLIATALAVATYIKRERSTDSEPGPASDVYV